MVCRSAAKDSYKNFLMQKFHLGVASDADAMEAIFHHAFYNELRVAPEEHNVLLTEPPFNPRSHRTLLNQLLFETFNVPGTHFVFPAIVGAYYGSRFTCVVVDIGKSFA